MLRASGMMVCAGLFWVISAARGDDTLAQYFDGLRSRQLYIVAENEALRRIGDRRTDPDLHAELTAELSATLVEHASQRTGNEQSELLARAEKVVADFLNSQPEHPGIAFVWLQQARIATVWGGVLAWRADVFTQDEALRREAVTTLEAGIEQLREVEDVLDSDSSGWADPLTDRERSQLQQNASRSIAAALIHLGSLVNASERTAALSEADQRLASLEERTHDSAQQLELRLQRLTIARLRGDREKAESLAHVLQSPDVPLSVAQSAAAELVRVDLAAGDMVSAVSRLQEAERLWSGAVSSELMAVKFEVLRSQHSAATSDGNQTLAGEHRQQIEGILSELTGPWGERSRILWQQSTQLDQYGTELMAAIDDARAAYAAGQWQQAADGFGQAVALAQERQQLDYAVDAAFTQGSILIEHEKWAEAAEAYRRVSEVHSESGRAADADLMRAWCLGRIYQSQKTEANRLSYVAALEEHRNRFPDTPSAGESAWMQGVLEESRLQWTIALRLYRLIPEGHARAEAAHLRMAHLHGQIIDRLRELGHDASEWEDDALDELGEIIARWPAPPALLTTSQSELIVQTARLAMAHRERGYDVADELLERAFASIESAEREAERRREELDAAWAPIEQAALQLRIVSLAGQGRADEAQRLLDSLSAGGDPVALLGVLLGLSEMGPGMNIVQVRDLGRLQLQTAGRLEENRDQLSEAQRQQLDICLAQALAATGKLQEAVAKWQELVAAQPDNVAWLEELALAQQARQSREAWADAKQTWQRIEAIETPGSEAWLWARWHIADCCLRLNEDEEARRLIGVTRVLYPELGGDVLRQQFDELEAELDPGAD